MQGCIRLSQHSLLQDSIYICAERETEHSDSEPHAARMHRDNGLTGTAAAASEADQGQSTDSAQNIVPEDSA